MSVVPLYFSRSKTKSLLRIPEFISAPRIFSIREEDGIIIFMTMVEKAEATHIPIATYESMESAVADMEDLFQTFNLKNSKEEE